MDDDDDDAAGVAAAVPAAVQRRAPPRPVGPAPGVQIFSGEFNQPPGNLDTSAPILYCSFCGASSLQVRWWVVLTARGPLGTLVQRPDGDLCFAHGSAVAVHPRKTLEALVAEYESDGDFKELQPDSGTMW